MTVWTLLYWKPNRADLYLLSDSFNLLNNKLRMIRAQHHQAENVIFDQEQKVQTSEGGENKIYAVLLSKQL